MVCCIAPLLVPWRGMLKESGGGTVGSEDFMYCLFSESGGGIAGSGDFVN